MALVKFTRRAAFDLDEIERYSISNWGEKVSEKHIHDISLATKRLQEQPALLREIPGISSRLQFYRVREHFLICDVIERNIYILAVRYGRMDLPQRILELEPTLIKEAEFLHEKITYSR